MLPRHQELALIEAAIAAGKRTIITREMKIAHDEEREKQAFSTQSNRVKKIAKQHFEKHSSKRNQKIKELTNTNI